MSYKLSKWELYLNSDGQQFNNIQKMTRHRSPQIIEYNKTTTNDVEIEVLTQDRHKNVTEMNRSMTSQPSPSW